VSRETVQLALLNQGTPAPSATLPWL
jgi:LysR family cys regulon transcriptional activator